MTTTSLTFADAASRSTRVRALYHQLEQTHHGQPWSKQEDVLGMMYDIGELSRLVMAAEGRWIIPGDVSTELPAKLAECMWWMFTLSARLGIDLEHAFEIKLTELESGLSDSIAKAESDSTL